MVDAAGGDPAELELAPAHTPHKLAGEHEESEFDPHWWHDPRNVEAAVAAIRDALVQAGAGRRRRVPPQRRPLQRRGARARRPDPGLHGPRPRRRAQARHQPRRVRLLHRALRHHGRRRADPVPVDARAALGGRGGQARRARPARARAGDLPRELDRPVAGRGARARDRARRPTPRSTATRSAPPAPTATPT